MFSVPVKGIAPGKARFRVAAGSTVPALAADFIVAPKSGIEPLFGGIYDAARIELEVVAKSVPPTNCVVNLTASSALRPDGRLDLTLPHLAARDDLGDLSRSFSRLLGEIGAYTDYLRTLASKLSHELNTPLAIVRSSLDNLEHEALAESARVYAQRARDGAERLSVILRSMAEASRMERAIQGAEGEDFDLCPLVRGCAEAYRDLAAPRRIALQLDAPQLGLHGAPELIAQALDKLVDNARSFTPEDGWIRIRLSPTADGAELAVANNGPPLPQKIRVSAISSLPPPSAAKACRRSPSLSRRWATKRWPNWGSPTRPTSSRRCPT